MEDWEYSDYYCPKCGERLMQKECEYCIGETEKDMYDEESLWYSRNEYENCSECNGTRVERRCVGTNCDVTTLEIYASIELQSRKNKGAR